MPNPQKTKELFDEERSQRYWAILSKMINPPPSDYVMDGGLVAMIQTHLDAHKNVPEPKVVWNTYKELLDHVVRFSWGSSFVVKLLDLEPFYVAPEGSYAQEDESIRSAPWRIQWGLD